MSDNHSQKPHTLRQLKLGDVEKEIGAVLRRVAAERLYLTDENPPLESALRGLWHLDEEQGVWP